MDERATKVAEVICEKTGVKMEDLLHLLNEVMQAQVQRTEEQILEMRIANLLAQMGLIPRVPAFQFLCKAIQHTYENYKSGSNARKLLKDVYKQMEQEYNRDVTSIQNVIRYLIKHNWYNLSTEMKEQIFEGRVNWRVGIPTNKEFILTMAEYLYHEDAFAE